MVFSVAGRLQRHKRQNFMLSLLSIHFGNRQVSVETVNAGEEIRSRF